MDNLESLDICYKELQQFCGMKLDNHVGVGLQFNNIVNGHAGRRIKSRDEEIKKLKDQLSRLESNMGLPDLKLKESKK